MQRPTSHRSPEPGRHDSDADPTESDVAASSGRPAGAAIAKVAALLTASMLLVGAIAAAAVTTNHRQPHSGPSSASQGAELTGARALDMRSAAAYAAPPESTSKRTPERTTTASAAAAGTPLPHDEASSTSSTPGTSAASGTATSTTPLTSTDDPDDVRSFVQNFYRLVDLNPQDALELVSRELVANAREELIRSWESMHDVVVRKIDLTEDGSVLALISMRDADGRHLRISQLLDLDENGEPRISGARVLSVQRNQ